MRFVRACFFVLLATPLFAQVTASLSGTVTDPAGATVSGAAITAKSPDTGVAHGAIADAGGHYQFFSLPVGQYEIHAAKAGFTEEVRTGVLLVVGQSATVDMSLQLGVSSQQVTVNEDAPLVGVTTADISGLVGEKQMKDLPSTGAASTNS